MSWAGPLAETEGFEPSIRVSTYNGLANRRLQPLGHVSASVIRALSKSLDRLKLKIGTGWAPEIGAMFGASSQRSRLTATSVASVDAFDLLKQISVDMQSDRCLACPIRRLIVNTSTPRTTDALTWLGRSPNDTSDYLRAVMNRRQSRDESF